MGQSSLPVSMHGTALHSSYMLHCARNSGVVCACYIESPVIATVISIFGFRRREIMCLMTFPFNLCEITAGLFILCNLFHN